MTEKCYLKEAALCGDAKIVHIDADARVVWLDRTWFHAQGGGQQSDLGYIGSTKMLKATHNGGNVDHLVDDVENFHVGDAVKVFVDEARRQINARYHTAGHLLAGLVERQFPNVKAVQGHQWPGEARVEFEGALPDKGTVERFLKDALSKAVADNHLVKICGDPYMSRGIQIGDLAPIPCGGTHVTSSTAIGSVVAKSFKQKGVRLRVSYEVT